LIGGNYLYFLRHNLESRLLDKRRPLLAGFKLTHRCNLRCAVCPFWKLDDGHMSFAQAQQTLDTLFLAGVRLLIFEGGEPFLWRDGSYRLADLVKEARKRFFCVGVTTNGTLPIDAPADVIWVSVDGLRETHNRNRGPCFDRVMDNIAASSHPNIFANVTINRLNWREMRDLVRFLSERVKGITIQFYYPYVGTENLSLSGEDRVAVLDELIGLKREGYPVADSVPALESLKHNTWQCHPWLIANVEPDGTHHFGCYLQDRAEISCEKCGFAAHTELSLAYDWSLPAIGAGRGIFGFR
jgi:MoaA/NifB/PqqE/SkfB family radical SAM enzyme